MGAVPRRVFLARTAGATALGGTALVVGKRAIDGPPPFSPPAGSLAGRTAFITGASAGLGKETAVRLAAAGATVVVGARSKARGEEAVAEVRARSGSSDVFLLVLDLADLQSVRRAAGAFAKQYPRLDILVNNAGVMAIPTREVSAGCGPAWRASASVQRSRRLPTESTAGALTVRTCRLRVGCCAGDGRRLREAARR